MKSNFAKSTTKVNKQLFVLSVKRIIT